MLKKTAMVFGVIFLLLGILGFVPGVTTTDASGEQLLFGLFMVDSTHNVLHIIYGVVGLAAATGTQYAKWYLIILGLVFALSTIIGFFAGNVLGLPARAADNLLHLVLAIALLGTGFGLMGERSSQKAAM